MRRPLAVACAAVLVLGSGAFLARTIASGPAPQRPAPPIVGMPLPASPKTPTAAAVIESIAPTAPTARAVEAVDVPAAPRAPRVARKQPAPTAPIAPKPHARPPVAPRDADVDLLAAMVARLRASDPAVRHAPGSGVGADRGCTTRPPFCEPADADDDSRPAAR